MQDWPRHEAPAAAILEGFAKRSEEWQEQLKLKRKDRAPQMPPARGKALPQAGVGGGYVVVFDDITQLIAAQRSAARGEVPRRLAHEIRNPLNACR